MREMCRETKRTGVLPVHSSQSSSVPLCSPEPTECRRVRVTPISSPHQHWLLLSWKHNTDFILDVRPSHEPILAGGKHSPCYYGPDACVPTSPPVEIMTPTVMALGGGAFGKWLVGPSAMVLAPLEKETGQLSSLC